MRATLAIACVAMVAGCAGAGDAVELAAGSERYTVAVSLAAARTGTPAVTLRVEPRGGAAPPAAVRMTAVLPGMGYASPTLTAVPAGEPGRYEIGAVPLMNPGGWQLQVAVDTDLIVIPLAIR